MATDVRVPTNGCRRRRPWCTELDSPPAEMECGEFFITPEDILDAIHTRVLPLAGHQIQEGPGAEGTLGESSWVSDRGFVVLSSELWDIHRTPVC